MSFVTEWALAIHRAVWFPVLWLTGLEAPANETPFLDDAHRRQIVRPAPARQPARPGSTGRPCVPPGRRGMLSRRRLPATADSNGRPKALVQGAIRRLTSVTVRRYEVREPVYVEGLGQEAVARMRGRLVSADQKDGRCLERRRVLDMPCQFDPVYSWESDVRDYKVRPAEYQDARRRLRVRGSQRLVTKVLQNENHKPEDSGLVIHHQACRSQTSARVYPIGATEGCSITIRGYNGGG